METTKRMRATMRRAVLACGLSTALLAPATARADVLEIGAAGATWIAGGPKAQDASGENKDGGTGAQTNGDDTALAEFPASQGQSENALTLTGGGAGPQRWHERIAQLAARYDISPRLLEAVVWQESRWNEGAVSQAGARGLAQLMPATAAQLGVDSNDPSANLEGGARYLRMQLDRFGGDVEKALAAYNAGPGRVVRAKGVPAIPETRAYVAAIMNRLTAPVRPSAP